jgi:hypothetical protein
MGTAIALPFLEAMQGSSAVAAGATTPKRLCYIFIPVGFRHMDSYKPAAGDPYTMSPVLEALQPLVKKITMVGNVANNPAKQGNGDAHERGTASLLTCTPAMLDGSSVNNGISVDQIAANSIKGTALSSLQVGVDESAASGKSVLSSNISWRDKHTPLAKETDPARLWSRLFTTLSLPPEELARQKTRQTSILHYANQSAKDLRAKLGKADQAKLDEYLNGLSELEVQINAMSSCAAPIPTQPAGGYTNKGDAGIAETTGVTAHHDVMLDLIAHAFACDITRVASFMFVGGAFSDWSFLGFKDEHHFMSHFADQGDYVEKLDKICKWEMERIAKFLTTLDSIKEADGTTVLDNTLVFTSSDVADGGLHNYDNLPIILAGGGGTVTKTGQNLALPAEQPLANLHCSMLKFVGVDQTTFGIDGTGVLDALMV